MKLPLSEFLSANNWERAIIITLVLAGLLTSCSGLKLNPYNLDTGVAPLPFDIPISFDDFIYDSGLKRVIIPAGETGEVALVDPTNMNVQLISGFSHQTDPSIPAVGTSSVALAGGFLFGLDHNTKSLKIVDMSTSNMIASTPLQGDPDYIRYISATGELWVSEYALNQIEIFTLLKGNPPSVQLTGNIPIPNGPEALIIDDSRGLAFTNRPKQGLTDVIQVMTHSVIGEWGNGCSQAMGMAIDEADGYLFVACGEGKLVVMDINNDGDQITSQNYGAKLDFVAYNPKLHHVYLPSSASGVVAIFQLQTLPVTSQPANANAPGITPTPNFKTSLLLLGTADTAVNAKCVTTDDYNNIWVCNPNNGQVFIIHDTFPDKNSTP